MTKKHSGMCPFCNQEVMPEVVKQNIFRRDKCVCPSCGKAVYVCRSPGCSNYAKSGPLWDHELCPSCTSEISGIAKNAVVTAIVAGVIAALSEEKSDENKV